MVAMAWRKIGILQFSLLFSFAIIGFRQTSCAATCIMMCITGIAALHLWVKPHYMLELKRVRLPRVAGTVGPSYTGPVLNVCGCCILPARVAGGSRVAGIHMRHLHALWRKSKLHHQAC